MYEQETPASANSAFSWGYGRIVGYTVLVFLGFSVAQFLAIAFLGVQRSLSDPGFNLQAWANGLESDGTVMAFAAIGSMLLGVPLLRLLAGRHETEPWAFLGFKALSLGAATRWCLALVVFIVASDLLTLALGRPVVPQISVDWYETVRHPVWLLLAFVVAAPIFEELFFRGFLIGALSSRAVRPVVSVVVASFLWSLSHLQYDLYGIAMIFLMGLILGAARTATGSVWPCLAMHALANLISVSETAYLAGGLAGLAPK